MCASLFNNVLSVSGYLTSSSRVISDKLIPIHMIGSGSDLNWGINSDFDLNGGEKPRKLQSVMSLCMKYCDECNVIYRNWKEENRYVDCIQRGYTTLLHRQKYWSPLCPCISPKRIGTIALYLKLQTKEQRAAAEQASFFLALASKIPLFKDKVRNNNSLLR